MNKFKKYFADFWSRKEDCTSEKWKSLALTILPIVVLHFILEKGLSRIASLPIDSYYNYSIFSEVLKKCFSNWYFIIFLLATIIVFNKRLLVSWTSFEKGQTIKLFLVTIAAILAWYYTTYNFNFYFNQGHYSDRLLLVVFVAAIYWRPLFIVPYIILLFSILWQFESFPGYAYAASPFLLVRIIILFLATFIFKLIFKKFQFSTFIFLLGCLVGSHYFAPGFGKLNTQWILNDHINYLLPATYASGWLSFLDQKTISTFTQFLEWFNLPLRLFTIVVECGIIFFFFHIKWARFIIKCAILMHIGIFIYSGIFFWMWISLLITLLFIFRASNLDIKSVFNRKYLIISILLIGVGKYWASARGLHWHDSPLSYSYRFYALTEDGERRQLPPNFFASYDFQFTVGNFKFLSPDPRLNILWGATDKQVGSYFNLERSIDDVFKFEKEHGEILKSQESQKIFKQFVNQYMLNWNTHINDENYLNYIQAPALYWTFPYRAFPDKRKKITKIIVNEATSYYTDKNGYDEIRNLEVLKLEIK